MDQLQLKVARREYRAMRANIRLLITSYPPRTADERQCLQAYKLFAHHYGKELARNLKQIRAWQLNELSAQATRQFALYYR